MKRRRKSPLLGIGSLRMLCALVSFAFFASLSASEADKKIIEANVEGYVKAYQAKDAGALAAFWSETGEFISPVSGDAVRGRDRIKQEYAAMFTDAGELSLEVEIKSLRFITPEVAVEEGTAKVIYPGELPSESHYRVIHTKQDGKWLIDSIRETVVPTALEVEAGGEAPAGVAEMKDLDWMIGDWIDEDERSTIYISCSWGMGKCYIKREFSVVIADRIEMDGIEVIGWDPAEKVYRSWVFDSAGGFGSAVWAAKGDLWKKHLTGTTKTGQKLFASHSIKKIDANTYQWRAYGRELDGKLLPNIDTVTVVRQSQEN